MEQEAASRCSIGESNTKMDEMVSTGTVSGLVSFSECNGRGVREGFYK